MTFSNDEKRRIKGIAFHAFRKIVNYRLISKIFKTESSIRKWYVYDRNQKRKSEDREFYFCKYYVVDDVVNVKSTKN